MNIAEEVNTLRILEWYTHKRGKLVGKEELKGVLPHNPFLNLNFSNCVWIPYSPQDEW